RVGAGWVMMATAHPPPPGAGLLHHSPVGSEIDESGQNPPGSVPPLRIDHPLFAPGRGQLDTVIMDGNDLEPKPLMIWPARDQRLHLFWRHFIAHSIGSELSFVVLALVAGRILRRHHHLADDLPVLNQPQPFAR